MEVVGECADADADANNDDDDDKDNDDGDEGKETTTTTTASNPSIEDDFYLFDFSPKWKETEFENFSKARSGKKSGGSFGVSGSIKFRPF